MLADLFCGAVGVTGGGLLYDAFEGREIHRDLIEEAVGGRPTYLKFMDFHTVLASQKALDLAGITGPIAFSENAEVMCDANGVPTGELREWGAIAIVDAAMPQLTDAQKLDRYHQQMKQFAAVGITGIHGMDGTLETLDILRELEASNRLITVSSSGFATALDPKTGSVIKTIKLGAPAPKVKRAAPAPEAAPVSAKKVARKTARGAAAKKAQATELTAKRAPAKKAATKSASTA